MRVQLLLLMVIKNFLHMYYFVFLNKDIISSKGKIDFKIDGRLS